MSKSTQRGPQGAPASTSPQPQDNGARLTQEQVRAKYARYRRSAVTGGRPASMSTARTCSSGRRVTNQRRRVTGSGNGAATSGPGSAAARPGPRSASDPVVLQQRRNASTTSESAGRSPTERRTTRSSCSTRATRQPSMRSSDMDSRPRSDDGNTATTGVTNAGPPCTGSARRRTSAQFRSPHGRTDPDRSTPCGRVERLWKIFGEG